MRTVTCKNRKCKDKSICVYIARTELLTSWEEAIIGPDWFDLCTRGCPHPKGVVLAGSSTQPRKVALINLADDKTEYWHDLPEDYAGDAIGMVFDDDVLTIAGGLYRTVCQPDEI